MFMLPLAMMLAGVGGYQNYKRNQLAMQSDEEDLAAKRADRQWQTGERQRALDQRQAISEAAAPMTPDAAPVAPPIGGRDEPRAPEDQGIRVGAATYTDPMQAQTAANAANTPTQQAQRVSDAMMRFGNVEGAQKMRSGAIAEQSAQLGLNEAQRTFLQQKWNDTVDPLKSWGDVAGFISNSKGDGQGGALKARPVTSADGKSVQIIGTNADGTESPLGPAYPNDARGLIMAKEGLKQGVSPQAMLTTLHQIQVENEAAAKLAQEGAVAREQMASHERVGAGNNAAMLGAAKIHAGATLAAAGLNPDGTVIEGAGLSDQAKKDAAARFNLTGEVPTNMGRGAQGARDLRAIQNEAAQQRADSGLSADQWAQRVTTAKKTLQAYGPGGKESANLDAVNTALNHLDTMQKLLEAQNNGNVVLFNKIANEWALQNGSAVPKNVRDAAQMVGPEITKAVVGAGGGVGERGDFVKSLGGDYSPKQIAGTVGTMKELLGGRLLEKQRSYERGTGLKDFTEPGKYLSPAAAEVLQRRAGAGVSSGASDLPPKNASGWVLQRDAKGNKAYVSPDGKQFEEVK